MPSELLSSLLLSPLSSLLSPLSPLLFSLPDELLSLSESSESEDRRETAS